MIKFITTINEQLFYEYGERALLEFDQYCGSGISMSLVFEGQHSLDLEGYKNIRVFMEGSKERTDFIRRFAHLQEANGMVIKYRNPQKTELQISFDYRFNAIRFSHKIFSIWEELERCGSDINHLIWMDADIRVLRRFEKGDLATFLPKGQEIASYLGRRSFPRPNAYSEGGWYAFNLKNTLTRTFIQEIVNLYTSGELFALKEWHDCMAFDETRKKYEMIGVPFKNLSAEIDHVEHPFVNCGLQRYFDHLKGPQRKRLGRSPEVDGIKENGEY